MGDEKSEHLTLIRRWLAGEVVNNTVGIKIVGGPFNGQTKIVELDQAGLPPEAFRGRPGQAPGPWNRAAKHTYLAAWAPGTSAGWVYEYVGVDTSTED